MTSGLGDYFGPSYFGGTVPKFLDTTGYKPEPPANPNHGDTSILQWIFDQIQRTGWFEVVTMGRNAGPQQPERQPFCWIYPIGFNERNDAVDLSIRQTTIQVKLEVNCDRDGDTFGAYRQLEELAALVVDLVETGPDWVDPSPGGLLSGRYDPPPIGGSTTGSTPLDRIILALTFAYSWNREK